MTIEPGGTFEWRGRILRYADFAYNDTAMNERAVELPIARAWLAGVSGNGLEVGNVLSHYYETSGGPRTVVDLWERAPGVRNEDLFGLTESFDYIVSISTLEHARYDGSCRDLTGGADAIAHLRSLLNPGGKMLVTIPAGHNRFLDDAVLFRTLDWDYLSTMVLCDDGWLEVPEPVFVPYASRTMWASAVWVAQFLPLPCP